MELLFKAICERIRQQLTFIRIIDLYNGQYQDQIIDDEDLPDFDNCIFVDFGPITWNSLGNLVQEGEAEITLHYTTVKELSTMRGAGDPGHNSPAFEYLRRCGLIHKAMHGWSATGMDQNSNPVPLSTGWMRSGTQDDVNHGSITAQLIKFRCRVMDYTAHPDYGYIYVEGLSLELEAGYLS